MHATPEVGSLRSSISTRRPTRVADQDLVPSSTRAPHAWSHEPIAGQARCLRGPFGCPCCARLRLGFRHCFVALQVGVLADLRSQDRGSSSPAARFGEPPARRPLRRCGHSPGWANPSDAAAPAARVAPMTCVEIVKRVLNVHAPSVLTPGSSTGLSARGADSLPSIQRRLDGGAEGRSWLLTAP